MKIAIDVGGVLTLIFYCMILYHFILNHIILYYFVIYHTIQQHWRLAGRAIQHGYAFT